MLLLDNGGLRDTPKQGGKPSTIALSDYPPYLDLSKHATFEMRRLQEYPEGTSGFQTTRAESNRAQVFKRSCFLSTLEQYLLSSLEPPQISLDSRLMLLQDT